MGACPYCRSVPLPSDTICYSCGRVLPKGDRQTYRLEQQFRKQKKNKETTYKMAAKPSQRGVVQTHTGRQKNILKRRKNRFRSIAMLGLVAFVMLSPQAQEAVFGEFGGVEEFLQSQLAPYHIYPNEATYTVSKISDVVANGNAWMTEAYLIPPVIQSTLPGVAQFSYVDDSVQHEPVVLQQTLQITVSIDGQAINVPIDGMPDRAYEDAIVTPNGHEIWWPEVGGERVFGTKLVKECPLAKCVMVKSNFADGGNLRVSFDVHVQSTSYSWWNDGRVDARVVGQDMGINAENSGTFADISQRGNGVRQQQFGTELWFDRGSADYAVNSQSDAVNDVADIVSSSLPEGYAENAYAFSRAAFDYMHAIISYDREAPTNPPRSGPQCLADSTGDCDEQTSAYFSILRTRNIPGWYVYGILGDPFFSTEGWEAHAWGYIQLPLSDSWCEERNIVPQTCFVEAQVDVVNNKWLLSTPTAYIDWIEKHDPSFELLNKYFKPASNDGDAGRGQPDFATLGTVEITGGTYKVKKYAEAF